MIYFSKFFAFTCFFVTTACNIAHCQNYNSVVISEIMADPTPVSGLPNSEYLEIYNRSGKDISVKNWKLVTGSRTIILPDSIIGINAYVIICLKNNMTLMSPFGKTIAVNSLSLTNGGMLLALYNDRNQLVYSISYLNQWWAADRRDGGFSLEMIDTENPCGEAVNWATSTDKRGGTPGQKNGVQQSHTDVRGPYVERVNVLENGDLVVVFNKRMDSLNSVSGSLIELSGRGIIKKQLESPAFRNLKLTLDSPLLKEKEYELIIKNISDCAGNLLRFSKHLVALPSPADSGDIVISEILFNPRAEGVDFVELHNRSGKYINLRGWFLSNMKDGQPNTSASISTQDIIFSPFSYLALTTSPSVVIEQYPTAKARHFLEMATLPVYPDAEGGLMLRRGDLKIFDTLGYSEKMHHTLLSDFQGVSLERIDPEAPSHEWSNWQSAASTDGYATPGYANSQALQEKSEDVFTVEPEAFSPDNDGVDDLAVITFKQSMGGRIATLRIFNTRGNLVKNLLQNQLIGTIGDISWNGTDQQGQPVDTGFYFLLIDTFDTAGHTRQYKKRLVVARRGR